MDLGWGEGLLLARHLWRLDLDARRLSIDSSPRGRCLFFYKLTALAPGYIGHGTGERLTTDQYADNDENDDQEPVRGGTR